MLIKVRKLPDTFGAPNVAEVNGELAIQAETLGELVKVPDKYREPAELMVGELSMAFFPLGIELAVGGDLDGLWVQREVLTHLRNREAAAA